MPFGRKRGDGGSNVAFDAVIGQVKLTCDNDNDTDVVFYRQNGKLLMEQAHW